jgi:hypothetical protein
MHFEDISRIIIGAIIMEASEDLTDSNLSLIIIVSSMLASFNTISICNMKNWSIQGYPIDGFVGLLRKSFPFPVL